MEYLYHGSDPTGEPRLVALRGVCDGARLVISGKRHINGEGSLHQKQNISTAVGAKHIHSRVISFWSQNNKFETAHMIIKYMNSIHERNFIASSARRSCTSSLNSPQRQLYYVNKIVDDDLRLLIIEWGDAGHLGLPGESPRSFAWYGCPFG